MASSLENFLPAVSCWFSPRLEAERARAELDHRHARYEVERLQLIVRLLGTSEERQG
jgi:hypothetical protein